MKRDIADRFWEKVDKNGTVPLHCPEIGPCWIWKGVKNTKQYGYFCIEKKFRGAHRVAFLLEHGRWPNPQALHKCDNASCVRHSHLFEGTQVDNMLDCVAKGRSGLAAMIAPGEKNPRAKLTWANVNQIREERATSGTSQRILAERFGVARSQIWRIIHQIEWKPSTSIA